MRRIMAVIALVATLLLQGVSVVTVSAAPDTDATVSGGSAQAEPDEKVDKIDEP